MTDNQKQILKKLEAQAKQRAAIRKEEVLRQSDYWIKTFIEEVNRDSADFTYKAKKEMALLHPDNEPPALIFAAKPDVWEGKVGLDSSLVGAGYGESELIFAFAERRNYQFLEFISKYPDSGYKEFLQFENAERPKFQLGWKGTSIQLETLYSELKTAGYINGSFSRFSGIFKNDFLGKVEWLLALNLLCHCVEKLYQESLVGKAIPYKFYGDLFQGKGGRNIGEKSISNSRLGNYGNPDAEQTLASIIRRIKIQ